MCSVYRWLNTFGHYRSVRMCCQIRGWAELHRGCRSDLSFITARVVLSQYHAVIIQSRPGRKELDSRDKDLGMILAEERRGCFCL